MGVVRGLDHAKGEQNRWATMMAATIRLNHASFRAACSTLAVPKDLMRESFETFGTVEALFLQGLGSLDAVGIAGGGFSGLLL